MRASPPAAAWLSPPCRRGAGSDRGNSRAAYCRRVRHRRQRSRLAFSARALDPTQQLRGRPRTRLLRYRRPRIHAPTLGRPRTRLLRYRSPRIHAPPPGRPRTRLLRYRGSGSTRSGDSEPPTRERYSRPNTQPGLPSNNHLWKLPRSGPSPRRSAARWRSSRSLLPHNPCCHAILAATRSLLPRNPCCHAILPPRNPCCHAILAATQSLLPHNPCYHATILGRPQTRLLLPVLGPRSGDYTLTKLLRTAGIGLQSIRAVLAAWGGWLRQRVRRRWGSQRAVASTAGGCEAQVVECCGGG